MPPPSESNLEGSAGWLARMESTRARLLLFAAVLPRAVLSSRVAARRSPETGIPAWTLGAREFGETATDELFIAISALYREVPEIDDVARSVERCRALATDLGALGVASAHEAPPAMHLLGLRRRRVGPVAFEHLEFESCPRLPAVLAAAGYGQAEVAHARVLRHRDHPRPWVVWLHGAEQGRLDDLFAFRVRHLHEVLGMNVALPVLPRHGPRREAGAAWPGFDLLGNVATMMRAVSDVRTVLGWVGEQDPPSIALVGMSLGGPVAALTAGLDPAVGSVVAMVPMLDAHATIAHHVERTGARGRALAQLLRDDAVTVCGQVIDPLALEPHALPARRLVVAALNDRMTSVRAAQRLHERWQGQVHWHPGGHIGHLWSGEVRAVLDRFLVDPSAG